MKPRGWANIASGLPVALLLHYNFRMPLRRFSALFVYLLVVVCLPRTAEGQPPRASYSGRTLLLPRRIVSGERATLAVLDSSGRLAPGVVVNFSNGDRLTTDATGRAMFVAPLDAGVIFASITGRTDRVLSVILTPAEASTSSIEIASVPRFASLADRFEVLGKGFCGDADANQVRISGRSALVLASSPVSLSVLPAVDLDPGDASVEISCAKRIARPFGLSLVGLDLEADDLPLKPDERRALTVRVRGTTEKISLEARNLAPAVAELAGGRLLQVLSSGGTRNQARFEVTGRKDGNFQIAIRLVPDMVAPH